MVRKIIDSWKKDGRIRGVTVWLYNYSNEFIIEYYFNETYSEITRSRHITKIYDRTSYPVKRIDDSILTNIEVD